ncbi:MAG: hypothetical protein IPK13_05640 [Deltaproteobacteria bacterium]|nr:hypothetical protein [Deltaproteobacteria bacterium]
MPERLVAELVREDLLPADLGRRALEQQVLHGGALDSAILETAAVAEDVLLQAIVRAYGGAAATPEDRDAPVDESALRCLPEQWAEKHTLAPLQLNRQKSVLRVLTPAPVDARLLERLGELLELRIVPSIDLEFRVYERLAILYGTRPPERFVALIEQARGPSAGVPWSASKASGSSHQRPSEGGRITFGEAVNMLREATEREEIVKTALLYTIRDLQFAAMLIVHKTHLEGWMAEGEGADRIPGLHLDLSPDSAFRVVLDAHTHYLGPVPEDNLHAAFISGIGRPCPRAVLIVPVRVKNRTVALIYAENGPNPIQPQLAADLMLFMTHLEGALEALLLRRKAQSLSNITPAASKLIEFTGTSDIMRQLVPSGFHTEETGPTKEAPPTTRPRREAAYSVISRRGDERPPTASSSSSSPRPLSLSPTSAPNPGAIPLAAIGEVAKSSATEIALDDSSHWERVSIDAWDDGLGNETPFGVPSALPAERPSTDLEVAEATGESAFDGADGSAGASEDTGATAATSLESDRTTANQATDLLAVGSSASRNGDTPMRSADTLTAEATASHDDEPVPLTTLKRPRSALAEASLLVLPPVEIELTPAPSLEMIENFSRTAEAREHPTTPSDRPEREEEPEDGLPIPEPVDDANQEVADDEVSASVGQAQDTLADGPLAELNEQVDLLVGESAEARRQAAEKLAAFGAVIVAPLVRAFPGYLDVDPFQDVLPPFETCGELPRLLVLHGRNAHPHIARFLDAPDPVFRLLASHFYASVRVPDVVPKLSQRLHDEEEKVRLVAARALFTYRDSPEFAGVVAHLHGRLLASSVGARRHAAYLLGLFRDVTAVPLLIEFFERKEWAMYDAVEQALGEITRQAFGSNPKKWRGWWAKNQGRSRIAWLIDGLSAKDVALRRGAFEELKAISGRDVSYDERASKREREAARQDWLTWWSEEEKSAPGTSS